MSAHLVVPGVIDSIRGAFDRKAVTDVVPYAGEFASEDAMRLTYTCPAVLVALLGWEPAAGRSKRFGSDEALWLHLAAFIVTNDKDRATRTQRAAQVCEAVALHLRRWKPSIANVDLGPVESPPTAENLHNRAMDAIGQALWMVRWGQAVDSPLPPAQLFDLVMVSITSNTRQTATAQPPSSDDPLPVEDEIRFPPT